MFQVTLSASDNTSGLAWCNNLYHSQALRVTAYRGRGHTSKAGTWPPATRLCPASQARPLCIDQASSSSWRRRLLVVEALHGVAGKVREPLGDSRPGHGNDAQLLQHAELVPADPVFAPQVVLKAADDDCSDLDGFAGGRDAHELGLLGSRCDHAPHDLVVVGDHILERPMEIGKGCPERTDEFHESLRPRAEGRR